MIGIVIVSHSAPLAEGVKALAEQMTQGKVPLATAGGIDDPDNPIGTDPMKVMMAIETLSMEAEDGILVMMDLGSALMSAETALDFLDDDLKAKIRLCAAPIVEGTMAAAVQASVGAGLDAAIAEAMTALSAKAALLAPVTGNPETSAVAPEETDASGETVETRLVVVNRLGLHARPAACFVSTAGEFESRVTIEKGGREVSAKSINQLATLAVKCNDEILVRAVGPDAGAAIRAIEALHADHFGETEADLGPAEQVASTVTAVTTGLRNGVATGIAASKGMAVGPVHLHRAGLPEVAEREVADPEAEVHRLKETLARTVREIRELQKVAEKTAGKAHAAIFDAHCLILEDPDLVDGSKRDIRTRKVNAEAVFKERIEALAAQYRNLDDAYMKERAADVMDAGGRLLRHLTGETKPDLELASPVILVAHDLLPSDVAGMDPEMVLGMITEVGGSTSHAAILARSLGIPAVVGAVDLMMALIPDQTVVLDGEAGTVELSPDANRISHVAALRAAWMAERKAAMEEGKKPGITRDGVHVHVAANIGIPRDAPRAFEHGAEGVGLFRTEFLFQERETAPTEDEQVAAYTAAAAAMGGHPVIIRTLDVGGDKPLAYLEMKAEENPFLGERGIRLCLNRPDVFRPQLRALVRAAQEQPIRVMFPMVAHPAELRAAKELAVEITEELRSEGHDIHRKPDLGIMIEVPSAVAVADQLAREADFFSIGTNDLTQYVMAADRGNAAVAGLSDALHPAVLRMVKRTVDAAHAENIPVGMCGELAGKPEATPLLLGIGLDELSMNAPSIPEVKKRLRELDRSECKALADHALSLEDGDAVRACLSG